MTQSLYEGLGGLTLPAPSVTTTLTPLDPARSVLSGLFSAALNAEIATVWTAASTGTPLAGRQPVNDILELPPTAENMKQRAASFPLLCVYRDGTGLLEEATLNGQIERLTQPWTIDYIVGPTDIGDLRKLGDVFQAAVKTIRLCIRRRGHPAYQNGTVQFFPAPVNGKVPLFPASSLLGSVQLKSYDGPPHYQAKFAGADTNTIYHAVSMHLETTEHSYDVDGSDALIDGLDLQVNAGGSEGIVTGLVYGDSDAPFQFG